MDVDLLLLGRVVERGLIVLFGGLSLYFGYRLFENTEGREGELEAKGGEALYIRLRNVAPGVFFAAFGALILGVSMTSPVLYETSSRDTEGTTRSEAVRHGLGPAAIDPDILSEAWIGAVALLTNFYLDNQALPITEDERRLYQRAVNASRGLQRELIDQLVGDGAYDLFAEAQRKIDSGEPTALQDYAVDQRAQIVRVQKILSPSAVLQ